MIEKVFVNLIKRHIVTKLAICTRIARGQREEWTAGVVDSEEDNGRRGQPQWWILKRAVFTFKKVVFNKKGSYLIKRVVFD